jgi:hypothetical protein
MLQIMRPMLCRFFTGLTHSKCGRRVTTGGGGNDLVRHQLHLVALDDHRQDQGRCHESKIVADAQARPAAEGEVGIRVPACLLLGQVFYL